MTDPAKDGGYAFPGDSWYGMTLRDYFAGQALAAVIARVPLLIERDPNGLLPTFPIVTDKAGAEIRIAAAELSYRYADAMLKVRKEGQG